MNIAQRPTHHSNYGDGMGGPGTNRGRRFVILHGTGKRPETPAENEIMYLQRPGVGVSYHYYVTKAGTVVQFVPNEARAWHAGSSVWRDDRDLNDMSIGVALESSNALDEVYPDRQVAAARILVSGLMSRYAIPASGVLTHRDVSDPRGRKIDPVNWPVEEFLLMLQSARTGHRSLPLYSEANEYLGTVTLVEERKAYLPDAVRDTLRGEGG